MIEFNKIDKQKHVAQHVLKKLHLIDPSAKLAGGAPRDWFLSKSATDLDFYVYIPQDFFISTKKSMISNLLSVDVVEVARKACFSYRGEHREFFDEWAVENGTAYTEDKNISCVFQATIEDVVCQIIVVNKPYFNVSTFCFDICQAYTIDGVNIVTTKEFNEAVKHKVIRITGEFYSHKKDYIAKIKGKFPDYLHVGF